jgi:hypothetical protein
MKLSMQLLKPQRKLRKLEKRNESDVIFLITADY